MPKKLMPYKKFKYLMTNIQNFIKERDKFSDFLGKNICKDTFCIVTFGTKIEDMLVSMIADEFECWYEFRKESDTSPEASYDWWNGRERIENDIENFLYRLHDDQPLEIEVDGKEFKINTIKELYDYLIYSYDRKYKI